MLIKIKPRLHLSLISLHEDAPRVNGGIGFSINAPLGTLKIEASEEFKLSDGRNCGLSSSEITLISETLAHCSEVLGLRKKISVCISGDMQTHVGMGSGTSIRLACLEALLNFNDYSATRDEIVSFSKRGGTSGIGVRTYFSGGFVFDLGRANIDNAFLPSSINDKRPSSLLLQKTNFPNWPLGLAIPRFLSTKSHDEEVAFFKSNTPIPASKSYEAGYYALFGVYASVVEQNYINFCKAVNALQECHWKNSEWQAYGQKLEALRFKLKKMGCDCVGLSSLGPLVFFFGSKTVLTNISELADEVDCDIHLTSPSNLGREITFPC